NEGGSLPTAGASIACSPMTRSLYCDPRASTRCGSMVAGRSGAPKAGPWPTTPDRIPALFQRVGGAGDLWLFHCGSSRRNADREVEVDHDGWVRRRLVAPHVGLDGGVLAASVGRRRLVRLATTTSGGRFVRG